MGNRREQSLGIRVGWILENGVPLGKLNNSPQVHDRNLSRDVANDRKIVRDEEVTQAKLILQIEKRLMI